MATDRQLLAAAAAEIGYTESPPGSNRNKYAAEAGHTNGQPWCASFVVAMFRRVGMSLPVESAYTPSMANGFKAAMRWSTVPHVGDLAFHDFPDSVTRIQHVDIVESVLPDGSVMTIGGNTSPDTSGSQSNGGGVYRRHRLRSSIVGFGRPAYQEAPVPTVLDFSGVSPRLFPQGVVGVMRYVAPRQAGGQRRPKCIGPNELAAHHAAGRDVGFVFEARNDNWAGGVTQGALDGRIAVTELLDLGVPRGVAIYAAVDRADANTRLPVVAAYLDAFHASTAQAGYRRGVYGSYAVVTTMLRDGHAEIAWQAAAWSDRQKANTVSAVVLYQRAEQIVVEATACDVNEVWRSDWGQYRAAPKPAPVPPTPAAGWDDEHVFCFRNPADGAVWLVEGGKRRHIMRPALDAYIHAGVLAGDPPAISQDDANVLLFSYPERTA